jgi:transcription initiation factor TFIIA large subunit
MIKVCEFFLANKRIESWVEPVTSNLVLGQFEKVARTKNKWKCSFKDGIMLLDGTEYIFGKGTAEFLW